MIKLLYPKFWQSRNCLAYLLLPLSAIYYLLGQLRHYFARPITLPAKVICVGNYTIGGTGKTQITMKLAQALKAKQIEFVIVSKGYGGSYSKPTTVDHTMSSLLVGDEALELCAYGTTIVSRKISDAVPIINTLSPKVIIVDDGAQNPNFKKDCVIMAVDGLRGFGNNMLFPAGPLRQNNWDADAVVVLDPSDNLENITSKIKADIFVARNSPISLDRKTQYYAFAGIGNPKRFFTMLKNHNIPCVKTISFPDHHQYSTSEIDQLIQDAQIVNAVLLTTNKDYVKLKHIYGNHISDECKCCDISFVIDEEDKFLKIIYEKIFS